MGKFRLVRKTETKLYQRALYYLAGIFVSLVIGAILLSSLKINCIDYYKDMFTIGLIGNKYPVKSIENLLVVLVPLLITSLALALSFKMRFWNIGGEGQFIVGAVMAATVAFNCSASMNPFVVLILMCLAGMITSGIIGVAIAALKIKFNTNETLATLMLNYIALYFIQFLGDTKADWNFFLREDSARPKFATFPDNAKMPFIKIGEFHLGYAVIISVIIAVLLYLYLKYTKQGYEISVVGDSSRTAKYAGMNVSKIVLRTMFMSAALIGLAGAFTASSSAVISTDITNNAGWTGVIVAWLSKLSVPGIVLCTILISILQYGCKVAASAYPAIDVHFADLLQGIILFSVLIADFLASFKIVRKKEETK